MNKQRIATHAMIMTLGVFTLAGGFVAASEQAGTPIRPARHPIS